MFFIVCKESSECAVSTSISLMPILLIASEFSASVAANRTRVENVHKRGRGNSKTNKRAPRGRGSADADAAADERLGAELLDIGIDDNGAQSRADAYTESDSPALAFGRRRRVAEQSPQVPWQR